MPFKLLPHCVVTRKSLGRYFLPCAFRGKKRAKKKKKKSFCMIEMMKSSVKTN